MAHLLATCAVALVCVGAFDEFTDSARAQAYYVEATPGSDENVGAFPGPVYGFVTEPRHTTSNFLRPHYGSYECATDEGHGYHWPCSRPGSRH